MFEKKKADRMPEEFYYSPDEEYPSVENWFKKREWGKNNNAFVLASYFRVDKENFQLYVSKAAQTGIGVKWLGTNVRLVKVHSSWLSAEFPDDIRFELADVKDDNQYRLVNILYKVGRVDNVVDGWWLRD